MNFKTVLLVFSIIISLYIRISSQVVINEFSASNYSLFTDNYGRNEDWIELYNTTGSAFNLTGYYLSDVINNPTKWQFPAGTTIPANGFLRVWASGMNVVASGHIHTNYRLTQRQPNPEYVIFSDPAGNILESYHLLQYVTQINHSWGRTTNGGPVWGVFTSPTPNASNTGTSYQRYAGMPVFSINGGFYAGSVNVSITTTEPNSVIRYTTGGNTPDISSTVYSGPINVSTTRIIQARVYSNDPQILPSIYEFHTYFINVTHTIPVVSIAGTNLSNLLNGSYSVPHGCVEYYENQQLETKVTGEFNKHGNDSWAYPQRGIDFISRDEFGYADALRHEIFVQTPRQRFQRIMFKAAANDNYPFENGAHIRDAYIHELSQRADLELDERSYEPCVLYMNGQYWGVYETREKVDDPDFTRFYYNQERKDLYYLKTWGSTWAEYGGAAATADWNNLLNYIQNNNMGDPVHYAYVGDRLNLLSLIDYFIINTHTVCQDWLNWNTGWWRGTNPSGQALKWRYTLWDMDATFGHYINYTGIPNSSPNADPCFGQNLPNPGGQGHTSIINKLYNESAEFRQMYATRYMYLINGPLHCDNMILVLDELIARIMPEMPGQIARWGGNITTWQNNVQAIRNFINQRCITVEQGIVDCFDLQGPYNIVLLVNPPNSGSIEYNQTNITVFPHNETSYSTIVNDLQANAYTGYSFSHWEFQNHTPDPNIYSETVTATFNSSDTIIAHFTQLSSPKNITLIVQPPGSGQININSFTPVFYPWSGVFQDSTDMNLQAIEFSGYQFSHWTSQSHTLLPNTDAQQVFFMLQNNDTITAYFIELPDTFMLRVNVNPLNSGEVILNNNVYVYITHTETYTDPEDILLQANNRNNFEFSHWTINNHILFPDSFSNTVSFLLSGNDTVTAFFEMSESAIFFPVSFSPDGDGLNDYFSLFTSYELDRSEILIFTRWGEMIYSSKDPDFKWDGKYNGNYCKNDVYVYLFSYVLKGTTDIKEITGTVTIVR